MSFRCPRCNNFVSNVEAKVSVRGWDEEAISEVTGRCISHGKVILTEWEWEDFFPEDKSR